MGTGGHAQQNGKAVTRRDKRGSWGEGGGCGSGCHWRLVGGGSHTVSLGTTGGDLTELLFLRLPPMTPSLIFSGAIFFPFIFLFSSGTRGLLLRFLWPGPGGGGTRPPCPQGAHTDGGTALCPQHKGTPGSGHSDPNAKGTLGVWV